MDLYRKDLISPAKDKVSAAYDEYSALRSRLKALLADAARDRRERDFMQFEFDELNAAALKPGEDTELEERAAMLQNSERIYEKSGGSILCRFRG